MQRRLSVRLSIILPVIAGILSTRAFSAQDLQSLEAKANELYSSLNVDNIFNLLLSGIPEFLGSVAKSLSLSLAILIISIIFTAIKQNSGMGENIFEFISTSLLIISCSMPISLCFLKVQEHLSAMCGYMIAYIPTSAALHAASGNALTAAFTSASGSSIALLEYVAVSILLPCVKALVSISAVNAIVKKTNLSGIFSIIKAFCLWATGLCFTLFTGILTLQNFLQASADNLAMKGLKYGASRFIPIAGGMISESMKTVIASVSYLKGVAGISGIIFIIYTVIPPLCAILACKLFFGILCAFAKATGQNEASLYLTSLGDITNILSALLLGCSVAFVILLAVFMKTTVNI